MANHRCLQFHQFSAILILIATLFCGVTSEDRKAYIVYMGSLLGEYSPSAHHLSLLQEVVGSSGADILMRSYKRSFNGFAAMLTTDEAKITARMKGVVSVFPSRTLQLQTTRSWDFMGFKETADRNPAVESNVIVGVIDSGIWPESESFSDEGFGPPPQKWKGDCAGGTNFTCNNKLIGARYYPSSGSSARDDIGHGSHTASTAAGNKVKGASFFGLAQGTARGGVPSARIAAYKVCASAGCSAADVLSGFDDAISDGVDIITISIGGQSSIDFYSDPIAIGAFHAMAKGILTVNSAGNSGPGAGSIPSVAPWMLSVAASSIDRRIIDKIVLGNGKTVVGISVNSFTLNGTKFPLIYGTDASKDCDEGPAKSCNTGCLDPGSVAGKIVLCDSFSGHLEANSAGAVGSVSQTGRTDVAYVVPQPASALASDDYGVVTSYLSSTENPEAEILRSEAVTDSAAPMVASFSSRGPNLITPEILKPDVSAPGIDILAAFAPSVSPSTSPEDERRVKYTLMSGTSMSCPHVAGVAAYVKSFHPDWSPSAIKSAIMTTASPINASANSDGEFGYGSGHINPVKAINPGLVYEASKDDYIKMLCTMGYDEDQLKQIAGENINCPTGGNQSSPKDLNYPSMSAQVSSSDSFTIKFHRTVKNVGLAMSSYKAKVSSNSILNIKVVPDVLSFKALNETKSFDVTVTGEGSSIEQLVSASLVWSDGSQSVRSPIVVAQQQSFLSDHVHV